MNVEKTCFMRPNSTNNKDYCSVKDCNSKAKNLNIGFHYFPKPNKDFIYTKNAVGDIEKVDRLKAWQIALKLSKVTTKMKVCSLHFKKDDYILPDFSAKKRTLKRTAVPSCNLPGRCAKLIDVKVNDSCLEKQIESSCQNEQLMGGERIIEIEKIIIKEEIIDDIKNEEDAMTQPVNEIFEEKMHVEGVTQTRNCQSEQLIKNRIQPKIQEIEISTMNGQKKFSPYTKSSTIDYSNVNSCKIEDEIEIKQQKMVIPSMDVQKIFSSRTKRFNKDYCSVKGCNSKASIHLNVGFHYFPRPNINFIYTKNAVGNIVQVDRLEAWLTALKINKMTPAMKVCSLHFKKEDYILPDYAAKKRKLKKTAVPSCNLPGRCAKQFDVKDNEEFLNGRLETKNYQNEQLIKNRIETKMQELVIPNMDVQKIFIPRTKCSNNHYCSVKGCNSKANTHLSVGFHNFPSPNTDFIHTKNAVGDIEKLDRFKAWQNALKMSKVTPIMKVCSLHFKKEDYILPDYASKKRKLKRTAVPSCNLPGRCAKQFDVKGNEECLDGLLEKDCGIKDVIETKKQEIVTSNMEVQKIFSPRTKCSNNDCCSVKGCNSKANTHLSVGFHNFPRPNIDFVFAKNAVGDIEKMDRLKAWFNVLKISKVTPAMKVCSLHFRKDDYILPDYAKKKRKLKKTAVPSCNLPGSCAKQFNVKDNKKCLDGRLETKNCQNEQLIKNRIETKMQETVIPTTIVQKIFLLDNKCFNKDYNSIKDYGIKDGIETTKQEIVIPNTDVQKIFSPRTKCSNNDYCIVKGCNSKANTHLTVGFHSFPRPTIHFVHTTNAVGDLEKVDRFTAWQNALNISTVTSKMKVCSLHFKKDDYILPDAASKKRYLKKSAVPSRNLPGACQKDITCLEGKLKNCCQNEQLIEEKIIETETIIIKEEIIDCIQNDEEMTVIQPANEIVADEVHVEKSAQTPLVEKKLEMTPRTALLYHDPAVQQLSMFPLVHFLAGD